MRTNKSPFAAFARAVDPVQLAFGAGLLLSAALIPALMRESDLHVSTGGVGPGLLLWPVTILLLLRFALRHAPWRHARVVSDCAEYYGLFAAMALMGAIATYPIAALSHGFHDAALQQVDQALGFDWLAWYRTVAAHRWLQLAGTAAYRSIYLSPALLLGYFAIRNQRCEAYRFLAGFWLAAAITLIVFPGMTAVGPLSYLWHGPIPYMPESAVWQAELIPPLRADQFHWVELTHLRGLVEAPSFHAASATLYMITAWRVRPLRWPMLVLNGAMLLATPVEGTHYLVDMLLGACVAVSAVLLIEVLRSMRRRDAMQPEPLAVIDRPLQIPDPAN